MRLLITGGRDWTDWGLFEEEVLLLAPAVIIHGKNPNGADAFAQKYAELHGVPFEAYPADWERYGRAAGPIRNSKMIIKGKPDYGLAFPTENSVGTWDMVAKLHVAKIPFKVIGTRVQDINRIMLDLGIVT